MINYQKVIENPSELGLYKALTRQLLEYLEKSGTSTLWDLVRFVGGSDRRVLRLLDQMIKAKLIGFKKGYFILSSKVRPIISSRQVICPNCQGKIVVFPSTLNHAAKVMAKIHRNRPTPTFIFDQRPVTLDTTLRRVAYMIWRGDLQGKRIAVLGDDDLTSLAIVLSGITCRVTVFDIDKRLINFLEKQNIKFKLGLEAAHLDFTKDIPTKYIHKFDIFLTDPTPTPVSFTVFVNTGIKMLKKGAGKIGYVSAYSSAMGKTLELQRIITNMKLLITDIIPHFTEYEFLQETYSKEDIELLKKYEPNHDHSNRLSFFEHLLRLETTDETTGVPLKFTLKDMLGGATLRVLADLNKDPTAFGRDEDKRYIKQTARSIKRNKEKKIVI